MGRIFLSYARDDRASAECLARVLEAGGHSLWWDRHIDSGEEFSAEIEAELDKADVVLVAWSRLSVKSRWVRDEAAVGGDTNRLVPVSIDGSLPPMGFRQFQTLDLSGWKGGKRDQRTAQLLHSVERRLNDKGTSSGGTAVADAPRRLAGISRIRTWAIAATVVLMIAAVTAFTLVNRERSRAAPLTPTIALLPFTAASSDAELGELASQARDSVGHTFSQSGLPVRVLNSVPDSRGSKIDFLMSGDFSRSADKIIATVRLDEVAHGVTVFSHRFEADQEDVRDLPERIGAQMAGNLTWASPLLILDRRRPLEPAVLADLLQMSDFTGDPLQGYQNAKRVAAKAPKFATTQMSLAFNTAFVLEQLPHGERAEAVAAARTAADRAMVLNANFGDTYATWCLLHSETRMAECEDRLRAGRRVDPDAPFLNTFLSHLLRSAGRFDEALELTRLSYTHDLYVPTKIGWMLRMQEFAGEADDAHELYRQGARWWPEYKSNFFRQRLWGLIDRGDFQAMQRLEEEIGPKTLPAKYPSSAPLAAAVKGKSAGAAKRYCTGTEDFSLMSRCMVALSILGDQDGAYAIANKLYPARIGATSRETERIWLDEPDGVSPLEFVTSPAAAPLRRDGRYLALAERTGLLAYWRSGRPPDFCRNNPEPICAQLLKR